MAKALLETAGDMRKAGLMDRTTHEKIMLRHVGRRVSPNLRAYCRAHEPSALCRSYGLQKFLARKRG